jgi:hypothetical protein
MFSFYVLSRHNFSPHFLWIYLYSTAEADTYTYTAQTIGQILANFAFLPPLLGDVAFLGVGNVTFSAFSALFALFIDKMVLFLPQICLLGVLVWRYRHNLPVLLLLQTAVFVVYNKVITAQYFGWVLCLLPFCMPSMPPLGSMGNTGTIHFLGTGGNMGNMGNMVWCVFLGLGWGASVCVWLYQAYLLEFGGLGNYHSVWGASLGFHVVSAGLIGCIAYYAPLHPHAHRDGGRGSDRDGGGGSGSDKDRDGDIDGDRVPTPPVLPPPLLAPHAAGNK